MQSGNKNSKARGDFAYCRRSEHIYRFFDKWRERKKQPSIWFLPARTGKPPQFFCVHNNTIVNIRQVSEINRKDNFITLRSKKRLNCSRRMGRALYDYLASRNFD
ncbi:MAG: hypothetical protein EA411_09290 [Saprospirales bacterium]|nr:MAG: hypothetical protein EA411_09290 [Saprospirales bacterium]